MRDNPLTMGPISRAPLMDVPRFFAQCMPLRDGRTMTVVPKSSVPGSPVSGKPKPGFSYAGRGSLDYGPPPSATSTASFRAHKVSASTVVVSVRGEIDLLSVNAFRDYLSTQVAPDRTLVVDMSDLEFMGMCGLSSLSILSTLTRDAGGALALICGRPVQRLLKAAGQESMFDCYTSLEHAVGLGETKRFLA
ncbi:STAS domain-containing protein [Rhodococcus sp. KBS0724]|uniref:STAS domain-containing protein n=1 Tax=Rhodococcus sp. KBS0724 TaxID=1179674 RepID=UPI0037C5BD5B